MNLSGKFGESFTKAQNTESGSNSDNESATPKLSINFSTIGDYLILLISGLIAVVSVFLLILPEYAKINSYQEDVSVAESRLSEVQGQSQYLEDLVGLQPELESNTSIAEHALAISEDKIPYALDQLIQIAEKSGVLVDTLTLGGITEPENLETNMPSTVKMQMGITGSEQAVLAFFTNIEKAQLLVDVVTFQTTSNKDKVQANDEEPLPDMNVSLTIATYFKPDIEVEELDLTKLTESPKYDNVIEKLKSLDFYEPRTIDPTFGRENPFGIEESTPSAEPENEGFENQETDEGTGIE